MNKEKRALLLGMAIGDGYIQHLKGKKKNSRKGQLPEFHNQDRAQIVINHSKKQEEYIKYKAELLGKIFNCKAPVVIQRKQFLKKTGKEYNLVRIAKGDSVFKYIRRWLYPNGKKYISRKILNALNPHAIALWYMDDGNLKHCCKNKETGKVSSISLTISTCCDREQAEEICKYFKEIWNIEFRLAYHSTMQLYYIRANTFNGKKFIELVRPYIIPSMLYKII